MLKSDNYFECLKKFQFYNIFDKIDYPWQPIGRIKNSFNNIFKKSKELTVDSFEGIECYKTDHVEHIALVTKPIKIDKNILLKGMDILIMEGTYLEPGALIKSPTVIGENCQVRQGAYIRGNVITGSRCVIGHTTEIKNSILLDYVEAGHFAYIGDSIIGNHVNLGAGVKLANLQLRTGQEKIKKKIREIVIKFEGKIYKTGLNKLGALIGDNTEVGCNSVTSPGALISKNTWIYPNTTIAKGYYPPNSIIKSADKGLIIASRS